MSFISCFFTGLLSALSFGWPRSLKFLVVASRGSLARDWSYVAKDLEHAIVQYNSDFKQ